MFRDVQVYKKPYIPEFRMYGCHFCMEHIDPSLRLHADDIDEEVDNLTMFVNKQVICQV